MIRAISKAKPDQDKIMYAKNFHALEAAVMQTINDYSKYDQDPEATDSKDFSQIPLTINNKKPYAIINGAEKEVTQANAFCYYMAEQMDIIGEPAGCDATNTTTVNFTTTNGAAWYGLGGGGFPKTIYVDVNGTKKEGGNCVEATDKTTTTATKPGCKLEVSAEGQMKPVGTVETKYLKHQTQITKGANSTTTTK